MTIKTLLTHFSAKNTMTNLRSLRIEHLLILLPLLACSIFVLFVDSKTKGAFIQPSDNNLYVSAIEAEKEYGELWDENNLGNRSLSEVIAFYPKHLDHLLSMNGVKPRVARLVYFFTYLNLIFYLSWLFFNKSLKLCNHKKTFFPAFFGSVLYTFGMQSLLFLSGGITHPLILLLITSPAILYFFLRGIVGRFKISDKIFLGILLGLTMNTVHFSVAVYVCFVLAYLLIGFENIVTKIKNTLQISIFSILSGLGYLVWWTVIFRTMDPYTRIDPFSRLLFSGQGISGFFRLFFNWTIGKTFNDIIAFQGYEYYNSAAAILSIFIIWLIVVHIYSKSIAKSSERKVIAFLLLTILIAFFFGKGNQPPLGEINIFLYKNIKPMGLLRTPDTKFGLPVSLCLAFLVSLSLASFKNKFIQYTLVLCVILQILGFTNIRQFTGVPGRSKLISVPNEFRKIASIINDSDKDGALLFYPGNSTGHFYHMSGLDHTGTDILGSLISRPVIYYKYSRMFTQSYNRVKMLIDNISVQNPGELGIRYVVVRRDIVGKDVEPFIDSISSNPLLASIYSSNYYEILELDEKHYKNIISAYDSDDRSIEIVADKKNSSKYYIEIPRESIRANQTATVVFRNTFSPLWNLSSITKGIRVDNHYTYQDYANQWDIELLDPSISDNIVLKMSMKLHNWFLYAGIFSILSTSILFITATYYARTKR